MPHKTLNFFVIFWSRQLYSYIDLFEIYLDAILWDIVAQNFSFSNYEDALVRI